MKNLVGENSICIINCISFFCTLFHSSPFRYATCYDVICSVLTINFIIICNKKKKECINIDYKICIFDSILSEREREGLFCSSAQCAKPTPIFNTIYLCLQSAIFREHHHKNNFFDKIPLYMYAYITTHNLGAPYTH